MNNRKKLQGNYIEMCTISKKKTGKLISKNSILQKLQGRNRYE